VRERPSIQSRKLQLESSRLLRGSLELKPVQLFPIFLLKISTKARSTTALRKDKPILSIQSMTFLARKAMALSMEAKLPLNSLIKH
jgi:hypothetical protein